MIEAEIVLGKDKKRWIKVTVKNNINWLIRRKLDTVEWGMYLKNLDVWAIPYDKRKEFEELLGEHLIVWVNDDIRNNGGIDEDLIPNIPVMEGYSVEYDEEGNIVNSTGFKTKPWGEFQVKGFNTLLERDFLILADDAGLGKTYQVATSIEARLKKGELKRGLILCKASLIYNWRDEIHKHTHLKAEIMTGTVVKRLQKYTELRAYRDDWVFLVMSYETFRTDIGNLMQLDNQKQLDFIVCDESHKVKNPQSRLGKAIHVIPSFKYRYVLTATPLPNNPLEAYNYLKLGKKINMNWYQFQNRYAIFGGYNNKEIIGYKNIQELKELIQENMLRRRKKDKLKELPDIIFKTVSLKLTQKQEHAYEAVREEIMQELEYTDISSIPNVLSKLLRLQQVTNSLDLIGAEPNPNNSSKLLALDDILENLIESAGEKVILFSRFKSMVEIMQKRYAKYQPAVIHGDISSQGKSKKTAIRELVKKGYNLSSLSKEELERLIEKESASERQTEVYRFQEDKNCKLFIGCAPACREGLTLTAATNVIFIDCEWSPSYVEQAYSRAHRIGQKDSVSVHFLVCENTIDEKIQNTLRVKSNIAQEIIDRGTANVERTIDVVKEMLSM